jgi:hypothetical protein
MITLGLPLLASILTAVCFAGWVVFRPDGSWQRARQVLQEAERDVASWASAHERDMASWASVRSHELEGSARR